MKKALFLSCFLLILPLFRLCAQSADSLGNYWLDRKSGLPSNEVHQVIADHNGFLWLGTKNGVVSYNGYTSKLFTVRDGLPSNEVIGFQEDVWGRIWLFNLTRDLGYMKNDLTGEQKLKGTAVPEIDSWKGSVFFITQSHNKMRFGYRVGAGDSLFY